MFNCRDNDIMPIRGSIGSSPIMGALVAVSVASLTMAVAGVQSIMLLT